MIWRERLEYKKRRDSAILNPSEYLSLIIDGADQSAYGFPHFAANTKVDRGNAMKVRLIGTLQHSVPKRLRLLTMTLKHKTGANNIVETFHRGLTGIKKKDRCRSVCICSSTTAPGRIRNANSWHMLSV